MPVRQAEHPLPYRQPGCPIAERGDHTGQFMTEDRRRPVTEGAVCPGRRPLQFGVDESCRMNLNDNVIDRRLRLRPIYQLHSGRSRVLIRYNDCLHR
jgi:hypothetical protein